MQKVKNALKKIVKYSVSVSILYGAFAIGGITHPVRTLEIQQAEATTAPVLTRIAKCESDASQKGKSGQVLIHANKDGTVDIGKYQINTVWFAEATKQGLNLANEADNEAFAKWLYENKGTGDWSASASCWKK